VAGAGPEDRGMARERLQNWGMRFWRRESGAQALALCPKHDGGDRPAAGRHPDAGHERREVAERASMLKPEMGVIYMSGYAETRSCSTDSRPRRGGLA